MSLPIEAYLAPLQQLLVQHPNVILQAEPGAGKTTVVPLALLQAPWLAGQRIVMLEPRRLAARSVAVYMASCLGEEPGQTVGYRTRMDSKVSKQTRLEVVTEGVLTRMLQDDPALEAYGLVIFDEFHERSLQADLALALCLDVQANLRDELKLLLMSATLDSDVLSRMLGQAPVLNCPGRQFPVTVNYRPCEPRQRWDVLVSVIMQALQQHAGSQLVFLPGSGEIRRVEEMLRQQSLPAEVLIAPLYGDLDRQQQLQAITAPAPGRRKIVLATNIAETSLTIEGVNVVIDSGQARQARFDADSGMSRLQLRQISQASARQRAGRAGRLQAGVCYRLWAEAEQARMLEFDDAEIKSADMLPLVLELAQWGVRDLNQLRWLDVPSAGSVEQARTLARQLELLDEQGQLTELGRQAAKLGVHPRLAHMMLRASQLGLGEAACELAAMLGERPLLGNQEADLWEHFQALQAAKRGKSRQDAGLVQRIVRQAGQWQRQLAGSGGQIREASQLGLLLALAYPDRVAMLRSPGSGRYRLSNGRGAALVAHHPLATHPFLAVAELGSDAAEPVIRLAAPLLEADLRQQFAAQIEQFDQVGWDRASGAVVAQRQWRLGELLLQKQELTPDTAQRQQGLLQGIRQQGLDCLPWDDGSRQLCARLQLLREWLPEQGWPDCSAQALLDTLEGWLLPYLDRMNRLTHLSQLNLRDILLARLDWNQQQQLEALAPTHFVVPTGSRIAIDYSVQPPVLAVRLQELFGYDQHPSIAQGRLPLTLHLLSPAMRPAQVTQNLPGFWRDSYQLVKKDLKGRYPKHSWPDDPLQAVAIRGTKKQSGNLP
ncbi:MAG: ATP-dependent helicase HrpB [Gammaproteobacteria bacterium]|nr:ATP-dependent helicase HrpB [Gammaproteobacteria bacterium]